MSVTVFDGSIPRHYEKGLGPLLFGWSADELASRLKVPAGGRVLETACGTGIASEAMRSAMPDDVAITATDLNEGMLDVARSSRGHLPGLTFQAADAQALEFEDGTFDAVACQFGIMFMPDRALAMGEAARVLQPGGLLVLSTWDSHETNAPARIAHERITSHYPEDPPNFLELPWSMHDEDELLDLARAAGYRDVKVERVERSVEVPSARESAKGFVLGNPGIHAIRERGTVDPGTLIDSVEAGLSEALGDAPMRASLSCLFLTGRRP
jgi:SAM-dependent methyltransferase